MEICNWAKLQSLNARYLFDGKYQPATREEIERFEREIGSSLPEDYKDFLLKYGGLFIYAKSYIIESSPEKVYKVGDEISIGLFLGVHPDDFPYRLNDNYLTYQYRIPFNFLPITDDQLGFVCLSIKGEDKGKVYFWDAVEEEDVDEEAGEEPGYSNVYLLAHSFQEFINSLEKVEDDV